MFEISYIGKVQAQQRPRSRAVTSGGRTYAQVYDAAESRDFKGMVHCLAQLELERKGGKPLDVAVRTNLTVYCRIPDSFTKRQRELIFLGQSYPTRKPDVDNVLKSVLDAVRGVFLTDDKLVVDERTRKEWSDHDGFYFSIEPMGPEF